MTESDQTPHDARTGAQIPGVTAGPAGGAVRPRRIAPARNRRAKAQQAMKHWVHDTPARLHRRPAPAEHQAFPDLTPAEGAARTRSIKRELEEDRVLHLPGLDITRTATSVRDEPTDFTQRAEAHDEVARLTVYTLNAILLVMSFPVGMGMLIFNILGGENLRTTAHMIALTGLGIALNTTEMGSQILSVI